MFTIIPAPHPGPSKETGRRREDTQRLAARAMCDQAPLATTTMAERKEAIRHAEAAASVAADFTVAAATLGNRSFNLHFLAVLKSGNGEKAHAASKVERRQFSLGPFSLIGCGRYPFDVVPPRPFGGAAKGAESVFIRGTSEQRARHGTAE